MTTTALNPAAAEPRNSPAGLFLAIGLIVTGHPHAHAHGDYHDHRRFSWNVCHRRQRTAVGKAQSVADRQTRFGMLCPGNLPSRFLYGFATCG